jgi:hypothetical protein
VVATFYVFGFADVGHLLFTVHLSGRQVYWIMFLALSTIAFSVAPYYILFAVAFPNHSLFELGARCTDWKPSRETGVVFPLSSRH